MLHNKWRLESRTEIAFDGVTGSEYPVGVPVAAKDGRRDRLEFHELVEYVNELEELLLNGELSEAFTFVKENET